MTRVRYVNKKTGWVSVYESESYYDPEKKSSRPKRTYIGYEDPITKEFIPSSGQPGRKKMKKSNPNPPDSDSENSTYYEKYQLALAELNKQREMNSQLQKQLTQISDQMNRIGTEVTRFSESIQSILNCQTQ